MTRGRCQLQKVIVFYYVLDTLVATAEKIISENVKDLVDQIQDEPPNQISIKNIFNREERSKLMLNGVPRFFEYIYLFSYRVMKNFRTFDGRDQHFRTPRNKIIDLKINGFERNNK